MGLALLQEEVVSALQCATSESESSLSPKESQQDHDLVRSLSRSTAGSTDSQSESIEHDNANTKVHLQEWITLLDEVHSSAQGSVDVLNDLLNYDK